MTDKEIQKLVRYALDDPVLRQFIQGIYDELTKTAQDAQPHPRKGQASGLWVSSCHNLVQ